MRRCPSEREEAARILVTAAGVLHVRRSNLKCDKQSHFRLKINTVRNSFDYPNVSNVRVSETLTEQVIVSLSYKVEQTCV